MVTPDRPTGPATAAGMKPRDEIHVYPHGEEHWLVGLFCICNPYRDTKEPRVVIHRRLSHD